MELSSVCSYVIPWESRGNSCHLRFSCSEFYADSKKIGCHFLGHLKVIFRPLEVMTPRSHLFLLFIVSNTCLTSQEISSN